MSNQPGSGTLTRSGDSTARPSRERQPSSGDGSSSRSEGSEGRGGHSGTGAGDWRSAPRVRPIKACVRCHYSKIKCDFKWPHCARCQGLNVSCTWDPRMYGPEGMLKRPPRKRKKDQRKSSAEAPKRPGGPVPEGREGQAGSVSGCREGPIAETPTKKRRRSMGHDDGAAASTCPSGSSEAGVHRPCDPTDVTEGTNPAGGLVVVPSMYGQNLFTPLSRFMEIISRLRVAEGLFTGQSKPIGALANLSLLWRSYIYEGGHGDITVVSQQSPDGRRAFYNAFGAMARFAHGSTYLGEGVGAGLLARSVDVVLAMGQCVLVTLRASGDPLDADLVSTFVILAQVCVFAVNQCPDMIRCVYGLLSQVILSQYGPSPSVLEAPDIATLCVCCDVLSGCNSHEQTLLHLTTQLNYRAHWLRELASKPDLWTYDIMKGLAIASEFSGEVVISRFTFAQSANGGMELARFDDLDGSVQNLVMSQLAELQALCMLVSSHQVESTDHAEQIKHLILYHCTAASVSFLEFCQGGADRGKIRSNLISTLAFFLTDTSFGHPFNTAAYGALSIALACLHEVDRVALRALLLEHMPCLPSPECLTVQGAVMKSACEKMLLNEDVPLHSLLASMNFITTPVAKSLRQGGGAVIREVDVAPT